MTEEKIREEEMKADQAAEEQEQSGKSLYERIDRFISVKYMMTCFGLMAALYLFYLVGTIFTVQEFTYAGF